jgi:molybdopterin molybdotransferase
MENESITALGCCRRRRAAKIPTHVRVVEQPGEHLRLTASASALCGVAFTAAGFSIVGARRASDDLEAVTLALRQSLATADAVVLSGGVSAGAYDFVPAAVTAV